MQAFGSGARFDKITKAHTLNAAANQEPSRNEHANRDYERSIRLCATSAKGTWLAAHVTHLFRVARSSQGFGSRTTVISTIPSGSSTATKRSSGFSTLMLKRSAGR